MFTIKQNRALVARIQEQVLAALPTEVERIDDLRLTVDMLQKFVNKLDTFTTVVQSQLERAYLRRGQNHFGECLTTTQIRAHRSSGFPQPWVATVTCECKVGNYCAKCGPGLHETHANDVSVFCERG